MKTTKQRLAAYRARAEKFAGEPYTGKWKYWTCAVWNTPNNARTGGHIFTDSVEQYGRNMGDAGAILKSLRHTGWHADSSQDALIKGAVCRMRSSKGTHYIPVTYCDSWDGSIHYMSDATLIPKGSDEFAHEQAAQDAARIADHQAEREAEDAREYDAKDQAEQQIEAARDRIHQINVGTLALIREVKEAGRSYTPAVCAAIIGSIKDAISERQGEFHRIRKLEGDYWQAVSSY